MVKQVFFNINRNKRGFNRLIMGKKLTIEEVKLQAKKFGNWIVLDDYYKGPYAKLNCQCAKCGYKTQFVWRSIQRNVECKGCKKCDKALKLEFIRLEFEKEGYTLLTKIYDNNKQKLEYICPMGHRHSVLWNNWNSKKKHRCPYCAGNVKLNIEFIRAEFKKEGYELLTEVYEGAFQKLEYICPEGHQHFISWTNWQQGTRCPCFSNKIKPTIEHIRAKFAEEGYVLLTKIYDNNRQKLEYICPEGHRHSISWSNWNSKEKHRCPYCNNNKVSKWEKEIKKFLIESNIDHMPNDRTQLTNPETDYKLELDIWMPKLNKAIECNGLYWHEDRQHVDLIKKQLCKNQGIDLLVITDKEWKDDTDKCKAKLISFVKIEGS